MNGLRQLRLSQARPEDARLVFDLRNEPLIVALGESGKRVLWEEHQAWFARRLSAPESHRIYLVMVDDEFGGVLRFDRENSATATISIFLRESMTGRGTGVEAIKLGSERIAALWPIEVIEAFVMKDNARSERAFLRAGFRPLGRRPAGQTFVLETVKISRNLPKPDLPQEKER